MSQKIFFSQNSETWKLFWKMDTKRKLSFLFIWFVFYFVFLISQISFIYSISNVRTIFVLTTLNKKKN